MTGQLPLRTSMHAVFGGVNASEAFSATTPVPQSAKASAKSAAGIVGRYELSDISTHRKG